MISIGAFKVTNCCCFRLTDEEMEHIRSFNRPDGRMIIVMMNGKERDAKHKHYPFNIEF